MISYKKIISAMIGISLGIVPVITVKAMNAENDVPVVQVSTLKYSYEQMKQDLETLKEKYPEQIQVDSLGTTADGREILEADEQLARCVSGITGYEMHSTIQDSADAAGCSDYFVLKLGIPAVTIENGSSQCPMPIEEYQPMYQRNQNLWPALAEMYGEKNI